MKTTSFLFGACLLFAGNVLAQPAALTDQSTETLRDFSNNVTLENAIPEAKQIVLGTLAKKKVRYKTAPSGAIAIWITNPQGIELDIKSLELAVENHTSLNTYTLSVYANQQKIDWNPALNQAYTQEIPGEVIATVATPTWNQTAANLAKLSLVEFNLKLPAEGAWIVLALVQNEAQHSQVKVKIGYVNTDQNEYSVQHPQLGWLNYNQFLKRDYAEAFQRQAPSKQLDVPAIRLTATASE